MQRRAVNQRLSQKDGRVVQQELGLECVGAIDDQVVGGQQLARIGRPKGVVDRLQGQAGVESVKPVTRRLHLEAPQVRVLVEDLAIEVGALDTLIVQQADPADTRRGEVERHRRAQRPDAHHQDGGILQAALAGLADFRQDQLAVMAAAAHRLAPAPTNAS